MNDDPIDALERELVAAAHRATHRHASAAVERLTRRARRPLGRLALTAAVLVPVVVVVAVALAVRSGSGRTTPAVSSAGRPPQAVLAVLRQPGIAPDGRALAIIERTAHTVRDPTVTVERDLLRQISVTVAPGDTVPLDLVVVRTADGRQLLGLTMPPSSGPNGTAVMYTYATRTDQAYATVRQLTSGGLATWLGEGPGDSQDYAVVVPDGVARVRLDSPGHPTAVVHDNVAGFRLADTSLETLSKQLAMTWLDASGHVVQRVSGARLPTLDQLRTRVDAAVVSLRAHLAVLRQPGAPVDSTERALLRGAVPPGTTLIPSSARVARTTPLTGQVIVAIVRETTDGTAGVLVLDQHGGGLTSLQDLLSDGGGTSTEGPHGRGETIALVPDGVRAVALTTRGRTTRASVTNNVAILPGAVRGPRTATTWYGAHSRVIKRIPAPVG